MRILVVTWGFPRRDQRFLLTKINALAQRGHDVRVLCAPGDKVSDLRPQNGVRLRPALRERVRPIRRLVPLLTTAVAHDPRFVQRVLATTRAKHASVTDRLHVLDRVLPFAGERPDIVHFEFANWAAAYLAVFPFLSCPAVVTCHGSDLRVEPLQHPSLRRRLGALFARIDRIVCVSHDLARAAMRLGADPDRLVVIPEGIDTAFFTRDGMASPDDDSEIRLVSVGRLHWVKGYDYALHAMRILRDRGHRITYTIAGHDEGAGDAIHFARQDLGLESVVRLAGPLNPVGVRNLLMASDIFVLSSVSEGLCRSAEEAMAMGLPVITTDVGGMPEAVVDGREGLVVPTRDPQALADAIESLVKDAERRRALGAAAAEHARRSYDSVTQVDRLLAVFHELVGST
jgi:colanic acid/amylovoran biosynthesis glycosyltransferase